jgi:repressor LexA
MSRGGQPLTRVQRNIMAYLTVFDGKQGYMPTFEEIAAHFGYGSIATVHEHLANLERKGWIARVYNKSRAITILHPVVDGGGAEDVGSTVGNPATGHVG